MGGHRAVRPPSGQVTLEITTMNKPDFCLNNARILAENPDVLENVKEILIVDQGTQKVEDQEGFAEVRDSLGGKLRVINQANLGGSGGFARGMYEAVENGSDYVLLLDDDIVVEPESIVRLLTFADHCRKPTIVGGHMFDLYNRSVLHTFGEVVDPYRIVPAAAARRHGGRGTTSASPTCARPPGCTAAWTWTTTAGGCA